MLTVVCSQARGQGGLDQRIAELSQQIAKEMTEYQKTTIAVVEFSDLQGNVTDFGRFLSEELITRLYQTKRFKVIERQLLNKIIAEQKLSLTGMVDPSSAKQLGKILGVDAIASGTITDLAQSLRVNARLISTETGEIFAVASTEIFKDESVMKLLGAGVTTPASISKPATTAATKAPARASKEIAPGMKFDFQGKVFEVKEKFKVTLVSLQILDGNRVSASFILESLFEKQKKFYVNLKDTYIVDQLATSYAAQEEKVLPATVAPHQTLKFFVIFDSIPHNTTTLNLRMCLSGGHWGVPLYGFVVFSDLLLN